MEWLYHLSLFFLFVHHHKIDAAEDDLHDGGARGCKTDLEHRNRRYLTHQIGNGDSHSECADDALNHNEFGLAATVEIACEAEKEAGKQAVDGVGLEIFSRIMDNLRLA